MAAMAAIDNLRGIPSLRPLRGRNPVIVACLADPSAFEGRAEELSELDARLVVEREPGPLSARLGRPSVTVCDRYLEVALHGEDVTPQQAVTIVRWLEMRCEECPQAAVDMAYAARCDWR